MEPTAPLADDTSAVVTQIPAVQTVVMAMASMAAYNYAPGQTPAPIGMFKFYKAFTGWNDVIDGYGYEESYGLIYLSTIGNAALVAFRGTATLSDLLEDLDVLTYANFEAHNPQQTLPNPTNVASGFYGVYTGNCPSVNMSMQQQLFAYLPSTVTTVYLTGHSLGGALSQFFSLDLAASLPSLTVSNINFASPQVGDTTFLAACNQVGATSKITRVINIQDIVPYYPGSEVGGYISIGNEFDTNFTSVYWYEYYPPSNHSLANLTTVLNNGLFQNPQGWTGQFTGIDGYLLQSTATPTPKVVVQQAIAKHKEAHDLLKPYFAQADADMLALANGENLP